MQGLLEQPYPPEAGREETGRSRMSPEFNPQGPQIRPEIWKPNAHLIDLALRRCDWINCDQVNALEGEEWLRAIIVGAYYQGICDIVKYNSRKNKETQKRP